MIMIMNSSVLLCEYLGFVALVSIAGFGALRFRKRKASAPNSTTKRIRKFLVAFTNIGQSAPFLNCLIKTSIRILFIFQKSLKTVSVKQFKRILPTVNYKEPENSTLYII